MNLAKEIIERLEGSGYLSKTLGDEAGKEWRKGRNDYVEAIITEKLSPILRENAVLREAVICGVANTKMLAQHCPSLYREEATAWEDLEDALSDEDQPTDV